MEIIRLPYGPIQTNCYLVRCPHTKSAVIIDPSWHGEKIAQQAQAGGYTVTHILLTHAHFDHVAALADLVALIPVPIYGHADMQEPLRHSAQSATRFGLFIPQPPEIDQFLQEGDVVVSGQNRFEVLLTPGHAPGHLTYWSADEGVAFVGDVLFQGSVGRTDLPGAKFTTLMESIQQKLLTLADSTIIYPGHGFSTTIGAEKANNPFLQAL